MSDLDPAFFVEPQKKEGGTLTIKQGSRDGSTGEGSTDVGSISDGGIHSAIPAGGLDLKLELRLGDIDLTLVVAKEEQGTLTIKQASRGFDPSDG